MIINKILIFLLFIILIFSVSSDSDWVRQSTTGEQGPKGDKGDAGGLNGALPYLYNDTDTLYFNSSYLNDTTVRITGSEMTGRLNISVQNDGSINPSLNLVNRNSIESTVWITGNESSRGTVKITHNYPGIDDSSASALSLLLRGANTAAQGIFIDINHSTGSPLKVTNGTITLVDFQADGTNIFTSDDTNCLLAQETDGTDVFRVSCNSNVVWARKLIPIGTKTYDLGDATHIWRKIHTQNVTMGDYRISVVGTDILFYNSTGEKVMRLNESGGLAIRGKIQENWDGT